MQTQHAWWKAPGTYISQRSILLQHVRALHGTQTHPHIIRQIISTRFPAASTGCLYHMGHSELQDKVKQKAFSWKTSTLRMKAVLDTWARASKQQSHVGSCFWTPLSRSLYRQSFLNNSAPHKDFSFKHWNTLLCDITILESFIDKKKKRAKHELIFPLNCSATQFVYHCTQALRFVTFSTSEIPGNSSEWKTHSLGQ